MFLLTCVQWEGHTWNKMMATLNFQMVSFRTRCGTCFSSNRPYHNNHKYVDWGCVAGCHILRYIGHLHMVVQRFNKAEVSVHIFRGACQILHTFSTYIVADNYIVHEKSSIT